MVVDHKTTVIRQTINFSGTKPLQFRLETFFLSLHNFGRKNRFILSEFPKKCAHVKSYAHRDHKKLEGTLDDMLHQELIRREETSTV